MSSDSVQLPLTPPGWFRPVAPEVAAYVPILQNRPGELNALRFASEEVWNRMTPLVQIVGPKNPGREPFQRERVAAWVKKTSAAVGPHTIFFDTLRLNPCHPTEVRSRTEPVLRVIAEAAEKRGMAFVPVLKVDDVQSRRELVANVAASLGRGIALRYRLLGTAAGGRSTPATLIQEMLEAVSADPSGADLLLDLGFLSEDVDVDPEDLAAAVDELVQVGAWRTVVLAGTAMCKSLGGGVVEEGSVGRLPRREWRLWCALRSLGLKRLPIYGDYAIQHPEPPLDTGSSGPGMRANIRYTCEEFTLVPRGVGPVIVEGAEQYRDLCRQILASGEFAGASYSWGDEMIAECAAGGETGAQDLWRGAGTSHHLKRAVDQIRGLPN